MATFFVKHPVDEYKAFYDAMARVQQARIKIPDLTPVRHSEWVEVDCAGEKRNACKNCGYIPPKETPDTTEWNFCPACGADLRNRKGDAQ